MALEIIVMEEGQGDFYGIWDEEEGGIVRTFMFWEEAQAHVDRESDRWRWNRRFQVEFFVPEGTFAWSPYIADN